MAAIYEQKGRLYLRASLPRKDGQPGRKQYLVTLGLDDTAANRRVAKRQLEQLEQDLKQNCFDWQDWAREDDRRGQGMTWRAAINAVHRKRVELGRVSQSTWDISYFPYYKPCPMTAAVTTKGIAEQFNRYDRAQYAYKVLWFKMQDIARVAGVQFPEIGSYLYGKKDQQISDLPSDADVIRWVEESGPEHRWHFGMMATYGLRPHEIELSSMLQGGELQVWDETKTGYRTVIPLFEDWIDRFALRSPIARRPSQNDGKRPDVVSVWLNKRRLKMNLQWRPYMLRHAYAARLWRMGGSELDVFTAAKLMGHSVKEHIETYRRHIDPNVIAVAAREAISRNMARTRDRLESNLRNDRSSVDS